MAHQSTSPEIYRQLKLINKFDIFRKPNYYMNDNTNESIIVYKQGITVEMRVGSIVGMITGVSIKFASILYEITYYTDGIYHTIWANEVEFEPRNKDKTQSIGFKQQ